MIIHTEQQLQWYNFSQTLDSRTTPHISPSRVSYGLSFLKSSKKYDRNLSGTHCMLCFSHCIALFCILWHMATWLWCWTVSVLKPCEKPCVFRSYCLALILFSQTSEEGAQTTIYCAVAPGIEEHSGGYFSDCRLTDTYNNAKDDALAKKLWDVSERLTGMVTKDQWTT